MHALLDSLAPSNPRWPIAWRAALSIGVPVLTGWVTHDVSSGLLATLGSFTALYGSDRPYRHRATLLAVIALSFAASVTAGVWAQTSQLLAVGVVVAIAMLSSFLFDSLQVGPPGAYMLILACAAGTAMPATGRSLAQVFFLVLAGGAVSWIVHMIGALVAPRGPERAAVAGAARAVAVLAMAGDEKAQIQARRLAASALHNAWIAVVNRQPSNAAIQGELRTLRQLNEQLHLLFSRCNCRVDASQAIQQARRSHAKAIEKLAGSRMLRDRSDKQVLPLGQLLVSERIARDARLSSRASMIALRVGLSVAIVGTLGSALGLVRSYWAMAAAVLVLHQGLNWRASLRRGLDRSVGTSIGLGLAAFVLRLHPSGVALVASVMVLQGLVELLVVRSYATAVVFVTAMALLVASGGHVVTDPTALVTARGIDTIIGCSVGLLVLAASTAFRRESSARRGMLELLRSTQAVLAHLRRGDTLSPAALHARQALQAVALDMFAEPQETRAVRRPNGLAFEKAETLAYVILGMAWLNQSSAAACMTGDETTLTAVDAILDDALSALEEQPGAPVDEQLDDATRLIRSCMRVC